MNKVDQFNNRSVNLFLFPNGLLLQNSFWQVVPIAVSFMVINYIFITGYKGIEI
jgi:hypothetical protein